MLINKTFFICTFLLISSSMARSSDFYIQNGHFKISSPDGWIKIPEKELKDSEDRINKTLKEAIDYEIAFQKKENKSWFAYPYILIQIENRGKQYSDYQIKKGIENEFIKKNIKKKKGKYNNIIFDLEENSVWYDETKNIVYSKVWLYNNQDKISALLAQVLSNYGAIRIMFYDTEKNNQNNYSAYSSLLDSIIIDNGYEFKKNNTNNGLLGTGLDNAVGAFIAAIILGILISIFRRGKNKSQ